MLSEINALKQTKTEPVKEQIQQPNTLNETDFLNKINEVKSESEKLINSQLQERLRDMR